jgi:hypothetical protein
LKEKSAQLLYGFNAELFVSAKNCLRASFSDGTPASRARAMLIAARSSGRPSRLLRSAPVTNSSISLPTCRDMPRKTLPAAASGEEYPALYAGGLRKAWISERLFEVPSAFFRSTVSVSIEWPNR